jgi:hypothetical protein
MIIPLYLPVIIAWKVTKGASQQRRPAMDLGTLQIHDWESKKQPKQYS